MEKALFLQAPSPSPRIPNGAVLVSFNVKSNCPDTYYHAAGSAVALGGSAFLWPEGRRVPQILRQSTFHRAIVPTVPASAPGQAFFAQHPQALAATRLEPKDASFAALSFVHWLTHLMRNHHRPLALLSYPYLPNAAHLHHLLGLSNKAWHALQREHAEKFRQPLVWLDLIGQLVDKNALSHIEAERHYQSHLVAPQHLADHDADDQGNAFFAALSDS